MSRRIERRMNVHRIEEPQTYVRYLRDHPHELDLLQRELLISVTSFFRDPEAFEALRTEALPALLAERSDDDTIRAWVPGCATGEEAYTVAIVLHEALRAEDRACELQVFGTDLDEQAIERARSGLYPHGIAADVAPGHLERYFTPEDDGYRIQRKIRDAIVFAQQNVISDPPFTRLDLIVCRNLLIYLVGEAQQRVLPSFHYALKPGGLLMLGSSESLGESSRLFESLDRQHRILRRRETPTPEPLQLPGMSTARRGGGHVSSRVDEQPEYRGRSKPLTRTIERFLLERLAGCTVVVDDQGTVVYLCGPCGQFLQPEQGEPRNRLLDMAREGLGPHLAAAVRKAKGEGRQVVQRGVRVETNGEPITVEAAVEPVQAPESLRGLVLVSLRSTGSSTEQPTDEAPEASLPEGEREQLERELRYTRESLQTTVEELETSNEELKSANEELQSTNEELQSSNEELETSKEELQSLNEELNTVNAELQSKVDALARSNDDMSNLLNSMQVATVFLDGDLRVKRYTRKAQEVIRLIDSDLGRPLSDLTSSLEYDALIDDCRKVLDTLTPIEKEVQDTEGRWMMVRVLPYRTADNVIEGLVMTIVDIDRAKRAQLGRDLFASIVDTVREPLLVLDGNLQVVQTNERFLSEFKTSRDATEQHKLYALDDGQWDIPELRRLLEQILAESTIMTDFVVEHDFPRIGHRRFLLNARRLEGVSDGPHRILLAFERSHTSEEGS
jgi:two-component system CheB/CheR fusion protein